MEQKIKPVLVFFFHWAPYTSLCLNGRTAEVRTIKLEPKLGQKLLMERFSMGEDAEEAVRDELWKARLETLKVVQGFAASDEIATCGVSALQISQDLQALALLGNWLSYYGDPRLQGELIKALEEIGEVARENSVSGIFPWCTIWPPI